MGKTLKHTKLLYLVMAIVSVAANVLPTIPAWAESTPVPSYIRSIGGDGTSKNLVSPLAVAVDTSGIVYIADQSIYDNSYRIVEYATNGSPLRQFGITNGYKIEGIAVDADQNVYVAEWTGGGVGGQVEKYSAQGTLLQTIGASGAGQLAKPTSVAIGADGSVYVIEGHNDLGGAGVMVYGSDGTYTGKPIGLGTNTFGIAVDSRGYIYVDTAVYDTTGQQVASLSGSYTDPTGVTVASDGSIYVLDAGDGTSGMKVVQYGSDYSLVRQFGQGGHDDGSLYVPYGIAVGANGKVYVADTYQGRVAIYSADGTYLTQVDGFAAASDLQSPVGVAVDNNGNMYVSDNTAGVHNRVAVFGSDGVYKRSFTIPDGANAAYPYGIAVTADGLLYVADPNNGQVDIVKTDGTFVSSFGTAAGDGHLSSPTDVTVGPNGDIYVADVGNEKVTQFHSDGTYVATYGTGSGYLYGVAVDQSGDVYVTDVGNNQVIEYDASGAQKAVITTVNGVALSQPFGVAVTADGSLYISDNNGIAELDNSLQYVTTLATPQNTVPVRFMASDSVGNLYAAYPTGSMVAVYGQATQSDVTADGVVIVNNQEINSAPVFSGTATFGSTVTVTVHSTPVTCQAIADNTGYWSCTLPMGLPAGNHTVLVEVKAPDGTTTTLGPYDVSVAAGAETTVTSDDVLAPTGENAIVLLSAGSLLVAASGALFTAWLRRR